MPLYEYVCNEDGSVIEVQRPMAEADAPLPDPEGKGRTFTRRLSTCLVGSSKAASSPLPPSPPSPPPGGCCCGRGDGGCRMG